MSSTWKKNMSGPNYSIESSIFNLNDLKLWDVDYKIILKELDELRQVVLILKRNEDMEEKYPKLKKLKKKYEEELEKMLTWERIQ